MIEEIKETMPNIIRCKECKYWEREEYIVDRATGENCGNCNYWKRLFHYRENDYCSRAERLDD